MNILDMHWIDFVVRTDKPAPYQLHIERIQRDNVFWQEHMLPKLKAFYSSCMLPELAAPRKDLCPGIREPKKPWVIILLEFIVVR